MKDNNNDDNKNLARLYVGFFFICCLMLLVSIAGCTGARINLSHGEGEVANKNDHTRTQLDVAAPIMEIIIPISHAKPNNPILLVEGLGRAVQTVTDGSTDARFNAREVFAGLGLRNQHVNVGLMANETDYVLTAEGYHQLTNVLRLRAGVEHRNTHQDIAPELRMKSTQAHVGLDAALAGGFSVGASYHTGNLSSELVQDRLMLNVGYSF